MIQAVIFDMDGLLIDSEPIWKEAEVEIFNSYGVPLTLAMTEQTTGLRVDEVVHHWDRLYPGKLVDSAAVAAQLDTMVIDLLRAKGKAKPGVKAAFQVCESLGLLTAIASSSSMRLIMTVVDRLGLSDQLATIQSAHDEPFGKPHPAVYLSTAKALGVAPEHCVAFEDSVNGVLSAKAAKMKCIAIPEPQATADKRFGIADLMLGSLDDFTADMIAHW